MCGIFGQFSFNKNELLKECELISFTNMLTHRGPDDTGFVFDSNIAFGHRRLSIIDIETGHQPMYDNNTGNYIIFNGEIYNYIELRNKLLQKGYKFATNSDTEVILKLYNDKGLDFAEYLNGMFSIVIYDKKKNKVILCRDRFGIKPLYYTHIENSFYFSSEIKTLKQVKGFNSEVNNSVIFDYIIFSNTDYGTKTFYKNIFAVEPASIVIINEHEIENKKYWDISDKKEKLNFNQASQQYLDLLDKAVNLRLTRSDVEVGCLLSGGLDSSSIVSLAKDYNDSLKVFGVIYKNHKLSEEKWINQVVNYTSIETKKLSDINELNLINRFDDILNDFFYVMEMPFDTTSMIASHLLYKNVSENNVKVVLTGQGADECLAGYLGNANYGLYCLLADLYLNDKIEFEKTFLILKQKFGFSKKITLDRVSNVIHNRVWQNFYSINKKLFVNDFLESQYNGEDDLLTKKFNSYLDNYLYHELTVSALPKLLRYDDRNSMHFSVESRFPFLDHRLVEFSFSLPIEYRIKNMVTKNILRSAMKNKLPDAVVNRTDKNGFFTPQVDWMKNSFNSIIKEHLSLSTLKKYDFLNLDMVKTLKKDFDGDPDKYNFMLWKIFCLVYWLENIV